MNFIVTLCRHNIGADVTDTLQRSAAKEGRKSGRAPPTGRRLALRSSVFAVFLVKLSAHRVKSLPNLRRTYPGIVCGDLTCCSEVYCQFSSFSSPSKSSRIMTSQPPPPPLQRAAPSPVRSRRTPSTPTTADRHAAPSPRPAINHLPAFQGRAVAA